MDIASIVLITSGRNFKGTSTVAANTISKVDAKLDRKVKRTNQTRQPSGCMSIWRFHPGMTDHPSETLPILTSPGMVIDIYPTSTVLGWLINLVRHLPIPTQYMIKYWVCYGHFCSRRTKWPILWIDNQAVNGKQWTCHSEWHDKTGEVVHDDWPKNWSCPRKDMTWQTVTGWVCNKEWANCYIKDFIRLQRYRCIHCIPKQS